MACWDGGLHFTTFCLASEDGRLGRLCGTRMGSCHYELFTCIVLASLLSQYGERTRSLGTSSEVMLTARGKFWV